MSVQLAEAVKVSNQHLAPRDVAAYVDRRMTAAERSRIESHLATCAECREEVSEAARIIATLPRKRATRTSVIASAAGIAAMLLVFLWPRADRDGDTGQHRESAITTTVSPAILAPVGVVESAEVFAWSSVPHANRYDVEVFDADGSVLWRSETADTAAKLPPTVPLKSGRPYYWKVGAHTGFDRTASTDLVEFSIRERRK